MEFDLDGNITGGPRDKPAYQELYIHAEVLRARKDVNSVAHFHHDLTNSFTLVERLQNCPELGLCQNSSECCQVCSVSDPNSSPEAE